MARTVGIIIHPGFQILDATGPAAALEIASRDLDEGYELSILAPEEGEIASSSGLTLKAGKLPAVAPDTVIVSGGEIVRDMAAFGAIVAWLATARPRRLASVCSGAFFLAEAGRLNGRQATTHWDSTERFRRLYPEVRLSPDRIFTRDGEVWTSAGISAGIDLTLALIEDDCGPEIAHRTAQQLVVHKRRLGGQSQYSPRLEVRGGEGRFGPLIEWMRAHLGEPLSVERLAEQAAMSPRNFSRRFLAETGTTPAKAVERLRLEAAQEAIESGFGSFEQIAIGSGFSDAAQMRRAFLRTLGQPPQSLRRTARQ